MKKFFSSINWTDHFINFIVVIVGVTIAFYLSNRKEENDKDELERNALVGIVDDLEQDINALQYSTDTLGILKNNLQDFYGKLISREATTEGIAEKIAILYVQIPFSPNDNTYQSLLTSGKLDVIKDFELRKKLVELYHRQYQAITVIDETSSQQKNDLIYPYLMQLDQVNTRYLNIRDPSFINATGFSLYYLTQKVMYDSQALEHAVKLRERINLKLEAL